jgi:hypothetical protein
MVTNVFCILASEVMTFYFVIEFSHVYHVHGYLMFYYYQCCETILEYIFSHVCNTCMDTSVCFKGVFFREKIV